ncbi:MAG: 1,4-alpha-glucan branching enzyme, partial [Amaricoccus sp.]
MTQSPSMQYASDVPAILRGTHGNPFAVLGMQGGAGRPIVVNVFAPPAAEIAVLDVGSGGRVVELERVHPEGFFSGIVPDRTDRFAYRLEMRAGDHTWQVEDPYRFPPILGELDEHLLGEGRHLDLYRRLGAHPMRIEGVDGVAFAVWAPNARRVSVVGDFNSWDGRRNPMRKRIGAGVWELFMPGLEAGVLYKYEILGAHGDVLPLKADPVSQAHENPPSTASIACGDLSYSWGDGGWMAQRA